MRGIALLLRGLGSVQAEKLPIKSYSTADGLARDQIHRVVVDSRGFIWFTEEGLSQFDGYKFTNYGTDNGLASRRISDLLETASGNYWVATASGVCRLNLRSSRGWKSGPAVDEQAGLPRSGPPKDRTTNGGHKSSGQADFTVYYPGEDGTSRGASVLYQDRSGSIWCGTDAGLFQFEIRDGQAEFHPVDLGTPRVVPDDAVVQAMLEDRSGALWVGTRHSGLYQRLPDGRVRRYTADDGLPGNDIRALMQDRAGWLWVGAAAGPCRFATDPYGGRLTLSRPDLLRDLGSHGIASIIEAQNGDVWLGTEAGLVEVTLGAGGEIAARGPGRRSVS